MVAMECTAVKTCTSCDVTKPKDCFPVARGRLGRGAKCKRCLRKYQVEYLKRDGVVARYKEINKKRYEQKKPEIMEQQRLRYHVRKKEPNNLVANRIRSGVRSALIGSRKSLPTFELLGYSARDLSGHLQRQFLPGMSWENCSQWHIDHIVPISDFIKKYGNSEEAVIKAWHLTNLRPIWAAENLSKRNKRLYLI